MTYPDGGRYAGEWRYGKYSGQGTFTWSDGRKYFGEFRNDKQHGQGTYTSPIGEKYVGEFRLGVPHGQGTMSSANGSVHTGLWVDGKSQEELERQVLEPRKNSCTGFGFTPDSDAHAQCVMQLSIAEKAQAATTAEAAGVQSAIKAQQAALAAANEAAADEAKKKREAAAWIEFGKILSGPQGTCNFTCSGGQVVQGSCQNYSVDVDGKSCFKR
jgi:hypothetical protein